MNIKSLKNRISMIHNQQNFFFLKIHRYCNIEYYNVNMFSFDHVIFCLKPRYFIHDVLWFPLCDLRNFIQSRVPRYPESTVHQLSNDSKIIKIASSVHVFLDNGNQFFDIARTFCGRLATPQRQIDPV